MKTIIGKIILKSIQIAFLSSLTIELLQLFLRLGTFQISDLFFNTIGGLAGGIIYFLVNAMAERIIRPNTNTPFGNWYYKLHKNNNKDIFITENFANTRGKM